MSQLPTPDAMRALHAKGASSNVAVATWVTPLTPERALDALRMAASTLPRWRTHGAAGPTLWLTRRTRLFRFVDDILVLAESTTTGTTLLLRSASRVGQSDLGQNARNLAELHRAFDASHSR